MTAATTARTDWTVSTTELALILGVRPQRIAALSSQDGMPKLARGRYDLPACIQHLLAKAREVREPGDVFEARKRLYQAQEEHKRLEIFRLSGTLVEYDEAAHVISTLAGIYTSTVQGLSPRLAQICAELDDPAVIEERLDEEFRELCQVVADKVEEFGRQYRSERPHTDPATGKRRRPVGRPKKSPAPRVPRTGPVAN